MHKFLIVEDDTDIQEIISIHLQNLFSSSFIRTAVTSKHGIEILKESAFLFNVIILDYNLVGSTSKEIFDYIQQKYPSIPVILHTSENIKSISFSEYFYSKNENNRYIQKPSTFENFKSIFSEIYDVKESIFEIDGPYKRIPIQYLYKFNKTKSDYYIKRIGERFIKLFPKDFEYNFNEINELVDAGVKYIYLKDDVYDSISSELISEDYFEVNMDYDDPKEMMDIYKGNFNFIRYQFFSKTLDKKDKDFIDDNTELVLTSLTNSSFISELVGDVIKGNDFIFEHSITVGVISSLILSVSDWATNDDISDLITAALIHDLLGDSDSSFAGVEIRPYFDPDDNDLKKDLNRHVDKIVKKLRTSNLEISERVIKIIEGHHLPILFSSKEEMDQKAILENIFRLSHEIVCNMYLVQDEEINFSLLLNKIKEKYNCEMINLLLDKLELKLVSSD